MHKKHIPDNQLDLLRNRLDQIINMKHELVILSKMINWDKFENEFAIHYCSNNGRGTKTIRLKMGLTILQSIYDLSDEKVVEDWLRDPYFQYFCGEDYFCHDHPIDPTGLVRFRKKIGESGMNKIIEETITIGAQLKIIKSKKDLTEITIDSTVQESNISYPTDSKLVNKARVEMVKLAKKSNIELRQNYNQLAKKSLFLRGLYQRQRKMKLATKEDRKLRTYLRRIIADFERKISNSSNKLLSQADLNIINRSKAILNQQKTDKNKIYSFHEKDIQCFSKGKSHKKYEFGSKSTIATTNKSNFILSILTQRKNRYDGHILKESIEKTESNIKTEIEKAFLDKGYRGNNYSFKEKLFISGQKKKSITQTIRKKIKRRNSIEQVNSILKNHYRLKKNYLKGEIGDQINANMAGFGYNFRKILVEIANIFCVFIFYRFIGQIFSKFAQKILKIEKYILKFRNEFCKKLVLQS